MLRLSTPDCEEFNAWSKVLGWDTEYQQLGQGKLEAWFEPTICGSLRIGHRYCSRSMSVCGTPPQDYVPLLLPLSTDGGARGIFHGHKLGDNDVAIICPGSEAFYRSPAEHHLITVSFPLARLSTAIETHTGRDAASLISDTRVLSLPGSLIQTLMQSTRRLVQTGSESPATGLSRVHLQEAEEELMASVCAGLAYATEYHGETLGLRNHLRYVKRARDYIHAHLDTPIELETLAAVTGVSSRALRYTFEQVLGISPKRYIKTCRLQASRQELLAASPSDVSVTTVANRFCFSHLGYFSRDYALLFGESPSQTLSGGKRSRQVLSGVSKLAVGDGPRAVSSARDNHPKRRSQEKTALSGDPRSGNRKPDAPSP